MDAGGGGDGDDDDDDDEAVASVRRTLLRGRVERYEETALVWRDWMVGS